MKTTSLPSVEEVAEKLNEGTLYMAMPNQYPENSVEKIAYADGVKTAAAFVYIDLTGTPKSKGILTQRDNQAYTSLVEGIEGMKLDKVKAVTNHSTPEEIHQGGLIDGKNQALTDILENVVKPLYGKS